MLELWDYIAEYNHDYQVSTCGRIKSLKYNNEKILNPSCNAMGYLKVELSLYNISKQYYVHRLVAETFLPNVNYFPQVNHKDEIKNNNNVDNLEWCTSFYNNNYNGKNIRVGLLKSKAVIGTHVITGEKIFFNSGQDASRHGFTQTCVSACCNYKKNYKTHKQYEWKYSII
jgi:hypothetical protein